MKKFRLAGPLVSVCVTSEKSYSRCMSTFDYEASAELFAAQGHPGFRYQRFAQAAESIRCTIEKLPPKVLAGLSLEVKDQRYNAAQIRALYESERDPARNPRSERRIGYVRSIAS
jgi:hypothetical protein